jgi:uncharacterized membrane-anchored protein
VSTRLKVIGLGVLAVAQLAAAAVSIVRYESVLRSGVLYRIRVAPVDPADAFRGRYVAVQPAIQLPAPLPEDTRRLLEAAPQRGSSAYAVLEADPQGFARAARIVAERPGRGDYLRIERAFPTWAARPGQDGQPEITGYTLAFSFDRYYMNEAAAPEAERRYAEAARRSADSTAWLAVRVKDGRGVIEGLYIDDVPIEQLVARSGN